jgi:hypothetical protein
LRRRANGIKHILLESAACDFKLEQWTHKNFIMKNIPILARAAAGLLAMAAFTGCQNTGSPYHPGPVAGQALGGATGVVAGNAVGLGKGVVGGTIVGYKTVMDPSYRMVRYWRTETTSDGRTIQVPYDLLVDQYGRPVKMPAPTFNHRPTPAVITNAAASSSN